MTIVYITYPGDMSTRFDRDYYRTQHLPLVMGRWKQHGLQSLSAFYPEDSDQGLVALCVCEFRDDDAVAASFNSTEAAEVMADVKHFTDVSPVQSKSVPLPNSR